MSSSQSTSGGQQRGAGELSDALRAMIEEEMGNAISYLNELELGDAGAVFVAEKLRGNTTVEELWLVHCGIGAVGTRALAESLAEDNITLKKLFLAENSAMGDVGAQAIAPMLKKNTTLEWLNLNLCGVADLGAAALGEALKESCTLKELSIEDNLITDTGAVALAEGLWQNESLQGLYLWNCQLTDFGVAPLLSALRESNSTLTKLDLKHSNSTLTQLDPFDYELEDEFDEKIIESIESMLEENNVVVPTTAERRARCLLFCCLQLAPTAHEHVLPSIGTVPVPVMRDAVEHAGKLHVAKRFGIENAPVGQSSAGVRGRSSADSDQRLLKRRHMSRRLQSLAVSDSNRSQSATSRRR